LWRAIYKKDQLYEHGGIKPVFFRDKNGLSCDLARFSSMEQSRRGYKPPPWPDAAGLVEFSACDVRMANSDIEHKPLSGEHPNYSHSQLTTLLSKPEQELMCTVAKFRVKPQREKL
jgi:hypothetical protein